MEHATCLDIHEHLIFDFVSNITPRTIVWMLQGRSSKSMGKGKIDSQPTKNPWTDRHQIWTAWLRRGPLPPEQLGSIHLGVFAPHIGEIYTPPVRNLLHFFGSTTRLQADFYA